MKNKLTQQINYEEFMNQYKDYYEDYMKEYEEFESFYEYGPLSEKYWTYEPKILVCNLEPYDRREEFVPVNLGEAHPNTAVIYLTGVSGHTTRIIGASVGGGNIRLSNIDGYEVEFTGLYPALITIHQDCPGVITKVTSALARHKVNIAFMRVSRKSRGAEALMILETDEIVTENVVKECREVAEVQHAFCIPAV